MGFFRRLLTAIGLTVAFALTIGTGGLGAGGIGFAAALREGARKIGIYFVSTVILGEVSNALTPRPNFSVSQELPVFAGNAFAQNLIGRDEKGGLLTYVDESDDDWLKCTFTVLRPSAYTILGIRVAGIYAQIRGTNRQLGNAPVIVSSPLNNRLKIFWNFTGEYNEEIHTAAGIPTPETNDEGELVGRIGNGVGMPAAVCISCLLYTSPSPRDS